MNQPTGTRNTNSGAAAVHSADLAGLPGWRAHPRASGGLDDASLIVATYQRPAEIEELIIHLATMNDAPSEVLVLDSSPNRETEQAAMRALERASRRPFELIYVQSPKGLTRQRNVGIDISRNRFVYFLDDDAKPFDGYFEHMRKILLNDADEAIAAVGACIINEIDKPMSRRWRIRRSLRLVPKTDPYIYNHVGTSAPTALLKPFHGYRDVDIFAGGACLIRRQVLEMERFSEFFQGYSYGEDLEMSLRIRRKWRIVCCGDAHVWHYGVVRTGGRPSGFTKGRMEINNRYLIWRRYSSHTTILNKIRFHADLLFLFLMDLAWLSVQPKYWHLSHAFGLVSAAVTCAISPPVWLEPPPVRRYCLIERAPIASSAWSGR